MDPQRKTAPPGNEDADRAQGAEAFAEEMRVQAEDARPDGHERPRSRVGGPDEVAPDASVDDPDGNTS
jgi:hypothetical protein